VLAPDGEVGLTRVGSSALIDSFETPYKCHGEPSKHIKSSIRIYVVNFSEATRL
jgi:hypothetical protein